MAVRSVDYGRFLSVLSVSVCFKYKRNRGKLSDKGAVEEKVACNIGVQGSNPGRDFPVCELFRMAKTDDSYVKIPTKTDQNNEKNVRALTGFGEVKATKTDDFLCLNPKNFSTRECLIVEYLLHSVNRVIIGPIARTVKSYRKPMYKTAINFKPI